MQAMHEEEPLFGMLNPMGQSSHAIELAAVLYMPVRQASQAPRPVELENSPGKHELHVLWFVFAFTYPFGQAFETMATMATNEWTRKK